MQLSISSCVFPSPATSFDKLVAYVVVEGATNSRQQLDLPSMDNLQAAGHLVHFSDY